MVVRSGKLLLFWSMKKLLILTVVLFAGTLLFAQPDSLPAYKQTPTIPHIPLLQLDSVQFIAKSVVRKKHQTVVIFFSPTCSHCQHQAEDITGNMKDFKDVDFLFVSAYSIPEIKTYVDTYGLYRFPNITVGQDPAFKLGEFYSMKSLPGIFVYDKQGKLTASFETNIKPEKLKEVLGLK